MNKENINIKSLEITKPVLEYLRPSPEGSYSRWDAYYDLVMRASTLCGRVIRFGQTFDLAPGEFIVTFTDLAKEWHWSRVTVRNFIKSLCDLGQLTVYTHIKCYQLELIGLRFNWSEGCHPMAHLNGYTREDGFLPLVKDAISTELGEFLSLPVSENYDTKLYRDEKGCPLYNDLHRQHMARVTDAMLYPVYNALLYSIYTPEIEKALLDVYFVVADYSNEKFQEMLLETFRNADNGLGSVALTLFDEMRCKASQLLLDVCKHIDGMHECNAPVSTAESPNISLESPPDEIEID